MKHKILLSALAIVFAIATAFTNFSPSLSTQVDLKDKNGNCTQATITLDPNCALSLTGQECMFTAGVGDIREIHRFTSNCNDNYRKP